MLDEIMKNLDGDMSGQLASLGIPPESTKEVMKLAQSDLAGQFAERAKSGDMTDLMNLFNGKQAIGGSSTVDSMVDGFASKVGNQFGISPEIAKSAAAMIIPMILAKLDSSTPSSGLTDDHLSQILKAGGASNMMDKLKGFFS